MVGIDADDMGTDPTITLEGVHDSIVSSRILQCYVVEIMKFLPWCVENKPNWLMADRTDHIGHIMDEHGGEGVHAQRSHTCTEFFGLLCSFDESRVLLLGEVTPHGIVEYAMAIIIYGAGKDIYLSQPMALFMQQFSICFVSTIMLGFQRFFIRSLEFYFVFFPTVDTISSAGGCWRAFTSWWR